MRRVSFAVVLMVVTGQVLAGEWERSVELGAVYITGNTEEDTIKLRTDVVGDYEKWRNRFRLDYLRSNKNEELSARKFFGSYKADYKISESRFLFSQVTVDNDEFSGFDYQTDVLIGHGWTLLGSKENMQLDLEVGPGYRYSKLDNGDTEGEAMIGAAASYRWNLSDNAVFTQKLNSDIGVDSTITRLETAVSSIIVGNLSMKFRITMKHNSEAPVGTASVDKESSISFAYKF